MKTIKKILSKRTSKAIVDILIFAGIFVSVVSSRGTAHSWWTFHCIASIVWYLLILVHIWQHWTITKLTLKFNQKALKRNKITLMAMVAFMMLTFSIITFVFKVSDQLVKVHHGISHAFYWLMIIHTIAKAKMFLRLFKNGSKKNQIHEV